MKRDIIVGVTSGYTFDQIKHWINSLDRSGFIGKRVALVGNADGAMVAGLQARGFEVVMRTALIDPPAESSAYPPFIDRDICVERYFLLWKYLNTLDEDHFRYVISVDMRDAIFQSDPAHWMATHLGDKQIVVSSEGLKYADEPWNRESMREAFGATVFEHMKDRVVWNCGTVAGTFAALRDLSLNLYLCSKTVAYADQAALNVLLALTPCREHTFFDHGEAGWACQAATAVRFSRGPELSYKFCDWEPLFDGDAVYTATGKLFCIVHQYDRIPAWKVSLQKKFA